MPAPLSLTRISALSPARPSATSTRPPEGVNQQPRPLLLGPLAHVDLALEVELGDRQLGGALPHQVATPP